MGKQRKTRKGSMPDSQQGAWTSEQLRQELLKLGIRVSRTLGMTTLHSLYAANVEDPHVNTRTIATSHNTTEPNLPIPTDATGTFTGDNRQVMMLSSQTAGPGGSTYPMGGTSGTAHRTPNGAELCTTGCSIISSRPTGHCDHAVPFFQSIQLPVATQVGGTLWLQRGLETIKNS